MATVAYARCSTADQSIEAQVAELEAAGAERVFVDHGVSSRIRDRPQWLACQDYLREGDTLLVRALDRLAGSDRMAIEILHTLEERGVGLRSLTEPVLDSTTPMGRAVVAFVAILAQLRVDTIRANTMRGLAHARSQGRVGGRPTVMTPDRVEAARTLRAQGHSYAHIAGVLGVGRTTVARALEGQSIR